MVIQLLALMLGPGFNFFPAIHIHTWIIFHQECSIQLFLLYSSLPASKTNTFSYLGVVPEGMFFILWVSPWAWSRFPLRWETLRIQFQNSVYELVQSTWTTFTTSTKAIGSGAPRSRCTTKMGDKKNKTSYFTPLEQEVLMHANSEYEHILHEK